MLPLSHKSAFHTVHQKGHLLLKSNLSTQPIPSGWSHTAEGLPFVNVDSPFLPPLWVVPATWNKAAATTAAPPVKKLLVRFLLLFHVKEYDAEQEEAHHHGEGTGIVWICRRDKSLVLCVLEGTHRHLGEKGNNGSQNAGREAWR